MSHVVAAGGFLPVGADDDIDAAFAVGEQAPARGEILFVQEADGDEDVVEIGEGTQKTGFEFSQLVAIELFWTAAADLEGVVALELKKHLAFLGHVAEEIGAGGFAFDEADLGQRAADGEVVVIGGKQAGADGVDDADGSQAHFGGDAAVAHLEKPVAGFFLESFVQIGFAGQLALLCRYTGLNPNNQKCAPPQRTQRTQRNAMLISFLFFLCVLCDLCDLCGGAKKKVPAINRDSWIQI